MGTDLQRRPPVIDGELVVDAEVFIVRNPWRWPALALSALFVAALAGAVSAVRINPDHLNIGAAVSLVFLVAWLAVIGAFHHYSDHPPQSAFHR